MSADFAPGGYTGSLVLADISGYSSFLNNVHQEHEEDAFVDGQVPAAYSMMSSMLEGIASSLDPPFRVLKFEGDAAFAVARDEDAPLGDAMIATISKCYTDFSARWAEADQVWTCTCEACSAKGNLDLKFIIHHGRFVVQAIAGVTEAVGPDVNLAHRLLKNEAASVLGTRGYALYTAEAVEALSLNLDEATEMTETVDDGRVVATRVIALN